MLSGVVRLSSIHKVFLVAPNSSSSVFPQKVLFATWHNRSIMLGRSLAKSLGFNVKDLDPSPFTIAT